MLALMRSTWDGDLAGPPLSPSQTRKILEPTGKEVHDTGEHNAACMMPVSVVTK